MKKDYQREPALCQELVEDFVRAAHGDFLKVQELYEAEPNLLHATVNWGGGDWESALGAASHTGSREIAEWLIEKGARLDLFAAAMLGDLPLVMEMLRVQPALLHVPGPHGIPLIHHAKMGGEKAKAVHEYIARILNRIEKSSSSLK